MSYLHGIFSPITTNFDYTASKMLPRQLMPYARSTFLFTASLSFGVILGASVYLINKQIPILFNTWQKASNSQKKWLALGGILALGTGALLIGAISTTTAVATYMLLQYQQSQSQSPADRRNNSTSPNRNHTRPHTSSPAAAPTPQTSALATAPAPRTSPPASAPAVPSPTFPTALQVFDTVPAKSLIELQTHIVNALNLSAKYVADLQLKGIPIDDTKYINIFRELKAKVDQLHHPLEHLNIENLQNWEKVIDTFFKTFYTFISEIPKQHAKKQANYDIQKQLLLEIENTLPVLSKAFYLLGDRQKALKTIDRIIHASEQKETILAGIAQDYRNDGDRKSALDAIKIIVHNDKLKENFIAEIAQEYRNIGDRKSALDAIKIIVHNDKLKENFIAEIAQEYRNIGDRNSALDAIKIIVHNDKLKENFIAEIAQDYRNDGDRKSALDAIKTIVHNDKLKENFIAKIAQDYRNEGDRKSALDAIKIIVHNDKLKENFIAEIAQDYRNDGDRKSALDTIKRITYNDELRENFIASLI